MMLVDFDRVINTRELRKLTCGQVRVYHVGNLDADRGTASRPYPPVDRAANVALHLSQLGAAALFQRRLGDDVFEYLIMGVGYMPSLQSQPVTRELRGNR